MKRRLRKILKVGVFLICLELIFIITGYFYLNSRLEKTVVSEEINSVPYYTQTPENSTLLFKICQDEILINLDFSNEILNIVFVENPINSYGYSVDYTLSCDYEMVGYFVDIAGGIEFENLRYTGVQITEKLEYSYTDSNFKRKVLKGILAGIETHGFTKENLLYIIENSETDLKFNQCFDWVEWIVKLCRLPRFVN